MKNKEIFVGMKNREIFVCMKNREIFVCMKNREISALFYKPPFTSTGVNLEHYHKLKIKQK